MEMKATSVSKKKEVGFIQLKSCSPGTTYTQIVEPCIALVGAQIIQSDQRLSAPVNVTMINLLVCL